MTISLRETLNKGIAHFQIGQFEEAEPLFQAVLHLQGNNGDALHLMGVLRQQQGRTAEAVAFLEKALKQDGRNVAFLANLSNSLIFLGEYKKAEKHCLKILKLDASYGSVFYHFARICFFTERLPQAIDYCQQAIENGQQSEQVLLLLARVYLEQDDLSSAEKYYRQVLVNQPDLAEAYNGLGSIYFRQRHIQKAYSMFYQALKKDSENIDALYNQGIVLRSLGKLEEAAKILAHAVQIESTHVSALASLALTLQDLGRFDEAIETYKKVLILAPDNGLANHMLSAMQGRSTAQAPADFVTELFDAYAPAYEDHLQGVLEFRAPKFLNAAIQSCCEAQIPFTEVLDLGCGTGLMAEQLKGKALAFDGVDLAEKMLDIARAKKLYRSLEQAEISEFLLNRSARYDCCVASDVLIYIGDLKELFLAVYKGLKPHGIFGFTIESVSDGDYQLRESGRYAHSESYISSLAQLCGFEIIMQDRIELRKENDEWLMGQVYILRS